MSAMMAEASASPDPSSPHSSGISAESPIRLGDRLDELRRVTCLTRYLATVVFAELAAREPYAVAEL